MTAALLLFGVASMPTAPADAGTIALFGATPTAGTVGYVGGDNPLFGTGISLDGVSSAGTPLNDGALATCVDCQLNFVTGNFLIGNATAWSFGGGGFFTITGGVDLTGNAALGDPGDVGAGSLLLQGAFTIAPSSPFAFITAGANPFIAVTLGFFQSFLHPALGAFFGEPIARDGSLTFSFSGAGEAPGAFTSYELMDVSVSTSAPVPEPATLALVAVGLLGAGRGLRRRSPRA